MSSKDDVYEAKGKNVTRIVFHVVVCFNKKKITKCLSIVSYLIDTIRKKKKKLKLTSTLRKGFTIERVDSLRLLMFAVDILQHLGMIT